MSGSENVTHALAFKRLTSGGSHVGEEFVVEVRFFLVLDAVTTRDGDEIDPQPVEGVTQQLSVVVRGVWDTVNERGDAADILNYVGRCIGSFLKIIKR